jgi:DNA-binding response OmpR family regulator
METPTGEYVVLTFSPQPSVADFLKRIVGEAGFASQAVSSLDDLQDAVTKAVPDAIIYEVGFPFSDNWHQLTELRMNTAVRHVPFVITTGDAHELFRRVGVPALELFRKPDDLSVVRDALLSAIHTAG